MLQLRILLSDGQYITVTAETDNPNQLVFTLVDEDNVEISTATVGADVFNHLVAAIRVVGGE